MSNNLFNNLGITDKLTKILSSLNYKIPTDIQKEIIPIALKSKNIVFTSQTGSGKTLAYTIPFLNKINTKEKIQMLIIAPTRELSIQIYKELTKICESLKINVGALYGGRDKNLDYKTISKKIHILIGTPGRIVEHINEKNIKVGDVKYLVFDESDQMFDNGFFNECAYIIKRVSRISKIILSSATITDKVKNFIENKIQDYEFKEIGTKIPKRINQEIVFCEILEKNDLLVKFFKNKKIKKALVFCNTKNKCYTITNHLMQNKIHAKEMNSNLEQKERENHLNLFKSGKINVLVTTDVCARGIHIENVDCIINYDVPTKQEFYVHRIGRTARSGKSGYSLTFICKEDLERFENIKQEYNLDLNQVDKDFKII
ncbi:MAG: DEAD/DEAH box helicase [Nanoarchaeota archaeon]